MLHLPCHDIVERGLILKRTGIRSVLTLALLGAPWLSRGADDLIQSMQAADDIDASTSSLKTIKDRTQNTSDEFMPLLAPPPKPHVAASRSENIFHGRWRLREVYRNISNGSNDTRTRLDTNGGLERINGGPYSLAWNGDVSYRNGNYFPTASDYQTPEVHAYQLALSKRAEDGGLDMFGRFVPMAMSGMGVVDGVQLERHPEEPFRLGAVLGALPQRQDLEVCTRNLAGAAYGTLQAGAHNAGYYSGSLGFFQTAYRGNQDELALLYSHQADLGPELNTFASTKVDFNTGAAKVHTETARMTQVNLIANSPINSFLAFRAGLNHFELPDTAAERDLVGGNLNAFDGGTWRYWIGSSQFLPWNLQLDEEGALIQAPNHSEQGQVRGTLGRRGLFGNPLASLSMTVYSLTWLEGDGVGAIFTGVCPIFENRLNLNGTVGTRYSGNSGDPMTYKYNDASLFLDWFLSRKWTLTLGLLNTSQDHIQSTIVDSSLSYRW
jgi:hypothetical protein